jgi:hypothetical protein
MKAHAITQIEDFATMLDFLVDELDWPFDLENLKEKDLTFEYTPEEIGLKDTEIAKVKSIKQLRPLVPTQPWAVFWMEFENKKLPVTILRRILRQFVVKKRAADHTRSTWQLEDIMFISAHGDDETRGTTFAHFKTLDNKEVMREFSWDRREKKFEHYAGYLDSLRWPEDVNNIDDWRSQWRRAFTGSTREAISTSLQLAKAMAWIAKDIKARVLEVYSIEERNGPLHKLLDSFRKGLIHSMQVSEFADMYAQTITYGLFSARTMDTDGHFELEEVIELIPNTNPFLKNLFKECLVVSKDHGQIDLDELGVGRLVDLLDGLNRSDGTDTMQRILNEFGRQTGGGTEDPVIHFYEGFLKEYDGLQRVERGVYYTPDPVVDFIVRSVHESLKTEFGLELGLADTTTWHEMVATGRAEWPKNPKTGKVNIDWVKKIKGSAFVQILDPATGTGTFLKHIINIIHDEIKRKHIRESVTQDWMIYWNNYVYHKLLPRLYAFELMMASYSVAHMKIGMHLKSLGYRFENERRLNIYLTNTLEPHVENMQANLFFSSVGAESLAANNIKQHRLFTVIVGNPPYSGISSNNNTWISSLIDDYKYVDGEYFGERKHWLNDDYVKFLRFGESLINNCGKGILGFINNHSFIDNPTFRGMRWHLLATYDKILIHDLHGSSLKKEVCPDGSIDQNVFDIQQGVSINIFTKTGKIKAAELSEVFHFDLFGKRDLKYDFLIDKTLDVNDFKKLMPEKPYLFFVPRSKVGLSKYNEGFEINELFQSNTVGFVTANDGLNISFSNEEMAVKISDLFSLEEHIWRIKYKRKKDSRDWTYLTAKNDAIENFKEINTKEFSYRPFDKRVTLYTGKSRGLYSSPQPRTMHNFLAGSNYGIALCKQFKTGDTYQHVFITNSIIESSFVSNRTSEITSVLPLYKYGEISTQLTIDKTIEKIPNLNQDIVVQITDKLGQCYEKEQEPQDNKCYTNDSKFGDDLKKSFSPIDLLDYNYSVLHSPTYRKDYGEFLKVGFPRIPYPTDHKNFWQLVRLGSELRQIHLLESSTVFQFITEFVGNGNQEVIKSMSNKSPGWIVRDENQTIGDVWINDEQYFSNVPAVAWNFYIGAYQPAQKWLKDRKGRVLSDEDVKHYQKIIVALTETDRIMQEIDKIDIE